MDTMTVPTRQETVGAIMTKNPITVDFDTPVRKVMTHRVITATEEMDIEEGAALMLKEGIARLPVLRGEKLVGILTRADIVQAVGGPLLK